MTQHTAAHDDEVRRNASVERYILALDAADFAAVAAVFAEAETDPALDHLLAEVDEALHAESNLPTSQEDAQKVRLLLARHHPNVFTGPETGPPTVGDVAAKLQAEHDAKSYVLLAGDLSANTRLFGNRTPLPSRPVPRLLRQIADATGVQASDLYWQRFRDAALVLTMARESGGIQLAAARERSERKPGQPTPPAEQP
jgi:hypothetical protein